MVLSVRRERLELGLLEEAMRDHSNSARRDGTEGRCAHSTLERGAFSEHRSGPHLRDALAVDLNPEHAVEEKVEVMALRALLDEHLAFIELAPREVDVAGEKRPRQLTFQCGLGSSQDGR